MPMTMSKPMQITTVDHAREALVCYGQRMAADRLVVGSAGNISIRLGGQFIMTPSGVNYDQISPADVCVLDSAGTVLDGNGSRSSEWPLHRKVYEITEAGAVVHTHSPFAVAASTICDEIPAVHYSVLRLGGPTVPVTPYATFGSERLAALAGAALRERTAVLLQNHGTVCYGRTLAEAYDRAVLLEWLAEVYWRARLAGSPRILSDAELEDVRVSARAHRYQAGGT
jgi:L-fuculose-phosphate aldolase